MHTSIKAACVAVAATVVLATSAAAAGRETTAAQRQGSASSIKDCTRFNGRYGYYGNPWCSPAEQARWDKWEARRLTAR